MNKNVRVRFAPSPTGELHLGGARTALFNYLFAKHHNGTFILRIEDTDVERSTSQAVKVIIEGLKWLGLDWDEGPYFQSERVNIYQEYINKLIAEGKAYYCYCSPDELAQHRELSLKEGRPPKYNGKCRNLTAQEKEKFIAQGRHPVVRFKFPQTAETIFTDLIKGEIKFDNSLLDDFVILKSNGIPTYNFAAVCDDHLLNITHIIRGDDHISNTPRQIQLYFAFGWQPPEFAHIPMILGPDRKRLSKRYQATSILEYKKIGYLPQVMLNYFALLGWSTEESQQIFSKEELIEKFSLERCVKSQAIFDPQKLLWLNGLYIRKLSAEELFNYALPFLKEFKIETEQDVERIKRAISLEQEKIKLLSEIPSLIDYMIKDEIEYNQEVLDKFSKNPQAKQILTELKEIFISLSDFSEQKLEEVVRDFCARKNLKTNEVFHPLRIAVSGRTKGPGLFALLNFLGKEKVIKRIDEILCRVV